MQQVEKDVIITAAPALQAECSGFTRQQVEFWAKLVAQAGLTGKQ